MSDSALKNNTTETIPDGKSANDDQGAIENINLVMDIPITLSLEIGRVRMRIEELMSLTPGSIVDLQKSVDESLDILVNGTLIAHGEAVVVDGVFGIRLTDVISKQDRLKELV